MTVVVRGGRPLHHAAARRGPPALRGRIKKRAAPGGAAKFREETPRKGRRHNKREVSHTALQQYGLLPALLQVQNFGISSQKPSISAPFRLFSRQSPSMVQCKIRIPLRTEFVHEFLTVTDLSLHRKKRFVRSL
jgi:hypothetical protein